MAHTNVKSVRLSLTLKETLKNITIQDAVNVIISSKSAYTKYIKDIIELDRLEKNHNASIRIRLAPHQEKELLQIFDTPNLSLAIRCTIRLAPTMQNHMKVLKSDTSVRIIGQKFGFMRDYINDVLRATVPTYHHLESFFEPFMGSANLYLHNSLNLATTLNDIAVYSLTNSDVAKAFEGYTLDDGSIIDSVDKARTYFEQYARYESVVSYLADYLMTNSAFMEDIPDEIVENEFLMEEAYISEIATSNGMTVDELLQSGGYNDMDAYLNASEEYIRQDLQYCFIIQAIAENLNIEVTDEDIESSYGTDADSAVATYGKGYVAQQVLTYLVMDELYTNAKIG